MKGCRPLSDREIASVLDLLQNARNRALFLLGLRSGFRISELLSLRLGDVFQNGNFVDRVAVERRHMKKKMEGRTVVLHPEARSAIETWVNELLSAGLSDPQTYLFRNIKGANRPIDRRWAWRLLRRVYAKIGLTGKLGTHTMRKTFARRVYTKLNRDLVRTQKALGHRNVNSTVSYLSFSEDEIDDAIMKS